FCPRRSGHAASARRRLPGCPGSIGWRAWHLGDWTGRALPILIVGAAWLPMIGGSDRFFTGTVIEDELPCRAFASAPEWPGPPDSATPPEHLCSAPLPVRRPARSPCSPALPGHAAAALDSR